MTTLLSTSCVKEVTTPIEDRAVDVIPLYHKGSDSFITVIVKPQDTKVSEISDEEKKKRDKLTESLKSKINKAGIKLDDPWVPPVTRPRKDLPIAMRTMPTDFFGYPDWSQAVADGLLRPKSSIQGGSSDDVASFNEDILFEINDPMMANVLFPHKKHTYWLKCSNCHDSIFKAKRGGNDFSMYDIWDGKFCGRCHGKVAFQPKGFENCQRCHSSKKPGTQGGMGTL